MFRLVKHCFKLTVKTRYRIRHQNVCDVITNACERHHFDLNNFLFGTKNLTLTYNSSHQCVIFKKSFGNDVTNNDVNF